QRAEEMPSDHGCLVGSTELTDVGSCSEDALASPHDDRTRWIVGETLGRSFELPQQLDRQGIDLRVVQANHGDTSGATLDWHEDTYGLRHGGRSQWAVRSTSYVSRRASTADHGSRRRAATSAWTRSKSTPSPDARARSSSRATSRPWSSPASRSLRLRSS